MFKFSKKTKGFTILELLISISILAVLISISTSIYSRFFNTFRSVKASSVVYEEARFLMEKITAEIRLGTIDYEEYFNQANYFKGGKNSRNETYGKNYCLYDQQFYVAGIDGQLGTLDDISVGERQGNLKPPISNGFQENLYLIQEGGLKKTYLKRVEDNKIGKVALLRLIGKDYGNDQIEYSKGGLGCLKDLGEGDGFIDTWVCDSDFPCSKKTLRKSLCSMELNLPADDPDFSKSSFIDITPNFLDVVELEFFIQPSEDPRKAYANSKVQIQPFVTIRLVVQANENLLNSDSANPMLTLESTVSTRFQFPIETQCYAEECIEGSSADFPCSKLGNLLTGASVSCQKGFYPSCTDSVYESFADQKFGKDNFGNSFYEPISEMGSCGNDLNCQKRRCSDTYDNDGDGLADNQDSDCLSFICNNGIKDPGEICVDVGGICTFRPKQNIEVSCFDGLDNDCNFRSNDPSTPADESVGTGADEFDQNCIRQICSNGVQDPILGNQFVNPLGFRQSPPLYAKNYLVDVATDSNSSLNETSIDSGGICDF